MPFQADELCAQRVEAVIGADLQRFAFSGERIKPCRIERGERFLHMNQSKLRIEDIGITVSKIVERYGIIGQRIAGCGVHVHINAILVF